MTRIATGANVCVFVLLLGLPQFSSAQPVFDQPQNPIAGSRVFGDKGCSKCHALNGVGGEIGPDLARLPGVKSVYGLAAAMWNHLPRMVEKMRDLGISRSQLTPQEAADLIAFLFLFNYFDPPGNVQEGSRLFTEKKCVVCHQVAGVGGRVGPTLDAVGEYGTPIYFAAAMWNHGPAMTAVMREKGIKRPTFTKSELLDLISYLKSASSGPREATLYVMAGSKEEGQRLFTDKGCIACHRIQGEGGQIGPDLTGLELRGGLIELALSMWNKAPKMLQAMEQKNIPAPQIKAGEMADIVAYLYTVQYFAELGDSAHGPALVEVKGCLSCHSLYGRGAQVADDIATMSHIDSLASVIAALWNHSTLPARIRHQRADWPQFGSQEMADLAAFLQEVGRSR